MFYRDFLAQPVTSSNAYSADTEAPDDDDAIIDNISDPEQQVQLRFAKYVHGLRNGAWGDHMAIQGIAINVLSSEHTNMIRVVPKKWHC